MASAKDAAGGVVWFICLIHDLPVPLDLWDELEALPAEQQSPEVWRWLHKWRAGVLAGFLSFVAVLCAIWFELPPWTMVLLLGTVGSLVYADKSGRRAFDTHAALLDAETRRSLEALPRRVRRRRLAEKRRVSAA